jgi:hypothetical protein
MTTLLEFPLPTAHVMLAMPMIPAALLRLSQCTHALSILLANHAGVMHSTACMSMSTLNNEMIATAAGKSICAVPCGIGIFESALQAIVDCKVTS